MLNNKEEKQEPLIHDLIAATAERFPERVAVIQGNRKVTYAELHTNITHLSSFLINAGVKKGDRIAILSENSPEYIVAYFATQAAGGIAVDLNFQYSAPEISKLLVHCTPVVLFVQGKYGITANSCLSAAPSVKTVITMGSPPRGVERNKITPDDRSCMSLEAVLQSGMCSSDFPKMLAVDNAAIIYTSGTTGEPKGVLLTHDNFLSNGRSIIDYLNLKASDRGMVILPFCYSYGKSILTTHLMVGGTLVLENSFLFPDVVLKKIIAEEVTGFCGVPSTFAILLNRSAIRNYSFPKLRYLTQAGGAMPPQHARELMQILPATEIYIMYGQTEAAPRLTYLDPNKLIEKAGSIGKSIPGVTIELITEENRIAKTGEEGQIVASGRNIMVGYWQNVEETKKVLRGGKLFTGDIATMDEDGYLYIVGRRSDMIKSGAHRISPKEIEEVILALPAVHETAVIGVEDAILGQAIKAFVILKEGQHLDAKEVQRHCQANLAGFKIPKEVEIILELPKTSSGKVMRHRLKKYGTSLGKDAATIV